MGPVDSRCGEHDRIYQMLNAELIDARNKIMLVVSISRANLLRMKIDQLTRAIEFFGTDLYDDENIYSEIDRNQKDEQP